MEFSLAELAHVLGATIDGPADRRVSTLAKIEEAGPDAVAFLANLAYENYLYNTNAAAVLVQNNFVPKKELSATLLRVEDPYDAFTKLLQLADQFVNARLAGREKPSYVSEGVELPEGCFVGAFAYISKGVKLGKNVKIFPHVFIGEGAVIGADTIIYSGAKLYARVKIGVRCMIHSGAVIGSDGFGHAPQPDGSYRKVPQLGTVIIGDDVEIGANTTVDRATLGATSIERGVKLDNLIQIGHNVIVGADTVIAALTGVGGSTVIGPHSMIGGHVGIANHLHFAAGLKVGGKSGITKSVKEENTSVMGYPALEVGNFRRSAVLLKNLPDFEKRLIELERKSRSKTEGN